jgi:hypothetical protein
MICICVDHPRFGVEVNGECPLHGDPHAADPPAALEAIADVVLAYRPKPKSKAAKKRKRKEAKKRV